MSLRELSTPNARLGEGAQFSNRYGFFDTDGSFVITDVLTPRPWVNVLANEKFGVVLSQAGSGFSWYDNCQLFRLSRWDQDLVSDEDGTFFYFQDLDHPDRLWSTTYQPTRIPADFEQVRHDLGATTFTRRVFGIESRHTVFVPVDDAAQIWRIEIENVGTQTRRLRVANYLEWHLGGIGDWHREFHRLFAESRSEGNLLLAWKHPGLVEHSREAAAPPTYAYVNWSGVDHLTWITDKEAFLGRCGSRSNPHAFVSRPKPSETPRWDDPIAAGMATIELAPGETRVITLTIGAEPSEDTARSTASRYDSSTSVAELNRVKANWKARCVMPEPISEDPAVEVMANRWLPYQAIAGRLLAKCAYYQQGGAFGYRDQLQDSLMLLDREPDTTLKQLKRHAEAMYEDGGVRHWWHPNTDIFVQSRHSDTCLWLAYGVLEYLAETGDCDALNQELAYLDRTTQRPGSRGTLFEHCMRGIDRALNLMSPRGLPQLGAGDWNDGLSHAGLDGKGESVWMAMFLFDILSRWQPYLVARGESSRASQFLSAAASLKASVHLHAWDGEWYIAGTRDDGRPFGSRECEEGKIFLNPQTWAVLSGIAPADRVQQAMKSAKEQLVTGYGALLLQPAYSKVDPYIGYITRYAPGLRENGGVYSHASTWAILAFARIGDTETARNIYRGMLPCLRSQEDADLYAAEPYVMPGNIDGPDSPYAGRAGWTWYTGSAAWMVRVQKALRDQNQG